MINIAFLFLINIFYYDKKLQDKINDDLKEELIKKGIKNKKELDWAIFWYTIIPKYL